MSMSMGMEISSKKGNSSPKTAESIKTLTSPPPPPDNNADFKFDLTNELKNIPVTSSILHKESDMKSPGVSRILDVKFRSMPHVMYTDQESYPFCPAGDEVIKLENQDAHFDDLLAQLIKDYEERDKWDAVHNQESFTEDQKTGGVTQLIQICGPKVPRCKVKDFYEGGPDSIKWEIATEMTKSSTKETDLQDGYWAKIFDRPCRGVVQSAFITLLEHEINDEIRRCKCSPPKYELVKVYEDLCAGQLTVENMKMPEFELDDYKSVRDSMEEPEEKLLARLKIYKRALSSIMYHFTTLRPILREIKTNYDGMIGLREMQMNVINLHKNNIGAVERKFNERLTEVRRDGYNQFCDAEKRCFLLLRHVDKQDAAIRTMTEILNNLEKSLDEEKISKMASEDQRKKLIMEINDLRRSMAESARVQVQDAALQAAAAAVEQDLEGGEVAAEEDLASINDSGILRNALEATRKSLSDAQKRLTVLEADYSDVVPKKEYEVLENEKKEADAAHKTVQDDYDTLSGKFQGIKDQIDQLIAERDDYQELVLDLKFKSTPRPSWSKIAEFVEGGMPRWQEIYQGKSSKEIVDQVVEILTGKKPSGQRETIPSLGKSEKIPLYLRYDEGAVVIQRYLTRREAAVLIHDIKTTRIEQLEYMRKRRESAEDDYSGNYSSKATSGAGKQDTGDEMPVNLQIKNYPDYFHDYMKERYPWPVLRVEWVYNLLDACKRFQNEIIFQEFLGILEVRVDEAVIHTFRNDVAKVRNVLIDKSTTGGHSVGSLPASEFPIAMREAFPNKTDEEIKNLVRAAAKQTGAVADWFLMKYVSFFVMTDEGLVGDFIEEFMKQFNEDRLEYVYEIINVLLSELGVSLQSAERENDPAGETDVTMPQIYSAITAVDSTIPEERIGAILAWIVVGESSLPGFPPKGLLLVKYIQDNIQRHPNAEADSDEDDDTDIAEFERAIDAIRARDDNNMLDDGDGDGAADEKKRKAQIKKMKLIPLRIVITRLKGGCLFRFGKKANVGKEKSDKGMTEESSASGGVGPRSSRNSVKTDKHNNNNEALKRKQHHAGVGKNGPPPNSRK